MNSSRDAGIPRALSCTRKNEWHCRSAARIMACKNDTARKRKGGGHMGFRHPSCGRLWRDIFLLLNPFQFTTTPLNALLLEASPVTCEQPKPGCACTSRLSPTVNHSAPLAHHPHRKTVNHIIPGTGSPRRSRQLPSMYIVHAWESSISSQKSPADNSPIQWNYAFECHLKLIGLLEWYRRPVDLQSPPKI